MNNKYRKILLGSFLVFLVFSLNAQTFEEFKKQIRNDYNSFEQETQKKFDDFVTKIDEEYSEYLRDNFGTYTTRKSQLDIVKPKPETIPNYIEEVIDESKESEYTIKQPAIVYQGPVYPPIKKTEESDFATIRIDVHFLGWPLYFDIDSQITDINLSEISPAGISDLWDSYAQVNYNHFIAQISEVANILNLNQWAYYQLIKECSQQAFSSGNDRIAFQWVMLTRSRYKSKIAYESGQLFLLLPSVYTIYNLDFITTNGIKYYVIDGTGKQIITYEKDFPESDILMDVRINKPFNTDPMKKSREYHFTHMGKKMTITLDYDEEMIGFYNTIPLSDIVVYFNSVVSNRTKNSVIENFAPLLEGLSETESLSLLLSFVQQAFPYKSDTYEYGSEKYLFPDEVLHYTVSDCEDRSVLFAFLVRTLLNKEVLAVSYPGHIATAVETKVNYPGISYDLDGKSFLICDPTFFGAPPGITISQVRNETPELMVLSHNQKQAEEIEQLWQKANKVGIFKSGRLNDIAFDNAGNAYLCGYFTDEIKTSENPERHAAVIKFDNKGNTSWVKKYSGTGNSQASSLVINKNQIFVAGSFENSLMVDGYELRIEGEPDMFIICLNADGNALWTRKTGVDKIDHSSDLIFAAKFNDKGEKIMAKLYSSAEEFNKYGVEVDTDGNALIMGSFFATTGLKSYENIEYNTGSGFDIPEILYKTDIELKQNEYEDAIAGLFSALKLLKEYPIEIQGKQIQSTFDTYNNKFSKYASGIYDNLKNMRFIKNDRGIITIKTSDGNPILFDKIKISNDARIRVVKYKSGNILVEVLSGIYVGGNEYWLDMNSIKLFKDTGDLLFDFDTDNSVKKINLKREILNKPS